MRALLRTVTVVLLPAFAFHAKADDGIYRGRPLSRLPSDSSTLAPLKTAPPQSALGEKAVVKTVAGSPRRRTASRNPNATDYSGLRASGTIRRKPKDWALNVGVLGGFSSNSTNVSNVQSLREQGNFGNNGYLGAMVDYRFANYFGADAEGFYNLASGGSLSKIDRVAGTATTETHSLRQFGIMAALKGRLPFTTGSVRWEPSVGAGFGMLGLTDSVAATGTAAATSQNTTQLWGFYSSLGIEVEPLRGLIVNADYARSFGATGDRNAVSVNGGRFERVRAGALVRIDEPFYVGAQFIGRRLTFDVPGAGGAGSERMYQYLGVLMLGL